MLPEFCEGCALATQVQMPSAEFQRITKDLSSIGDTGACPPHCQPARQPAAAWVAAPLCGLPAHVRMLPLPRLAVEITVDREGIRFSASGDIGTANIVCRQNMHADKEVGTGCPG